MCLLEQVFIGTHNRSRYTITHSPKRTRSVAIRVILNKRLPSEGIIIPSAKLPICDKQKETYSLMDITLKRTEVEFGVQSIAVVVLLSYFRELTNNTMWRCVCGVGGGWGLAWWQGGTG